MATPDGLPGVCHHPAIATPVIKGLSLSSLLVYDGVAKSATRLDTIVTAFGKDKASACLAEANPAPWDLIELWDNFCFRLPT